MPVTKGVGQSLRFDTGSIPWQHLDSDKTSCGAKLQCAPPKSDQRESSYNKRIAFG